MYYADLMNFAQVRHFTNVLSMSTINHMHSALQFKITLNYAQPKIWRRILVPEYYTFWDLHCAIQAAMGWTNLHLHAFYIMDKASHSARPIIVQIPNPYDGLPEALHEAHEHITDWFPNQIKQCQYTYDMGDSWDHTVLFERSIQTTQTLPFCKAGEGACPPKNCGDVGGYRHLLKALNDPQTEAALGLRDWLALEAGEMYVPEKFSAAEVQFYNPKQALKEHLEYLHRA